MPLRNRLKAPVSRILMPLAKWYLRKTRRSHFQDVDVLVPPGVFHPGLYLSTRFMLSHLSRFSLEGKRLWEIGAGSGMVAIWCARRGAHVTATDISKSAVAAIQVNAERNGVAMQVLLADLFEGMPAATYDFIVINPPYYPGDPKTEAENAFYCGAEFQYFQRLFEGLAAFCHADTTVRMVLSEDCKLSQIEGIGKQWGWGMQEVDRKRKLGEWNFIYACTMRGS